MTTKADNPLTLPASGAAVRGSGEPDWVIREQARRVAEAERAFDEVKGVAELFGMPREAYIREYIAGNFPPITWTSSDDSGSQGYPASVDSGVGGGQ